MVISPVIAILLGILGLKSQKRKLAIAGIVLGGVGLLSFVVYIVYFQLLA
jgi:hypothetical protein